MLTDSQYEAAKKMWANGVSVKQMAYRLGISTRSVTYYVTRYRFDFPQRHRSKRLTDAQRQWIIAMRDEGATIKHIADEIGCHENTVQNVLRAARNKRKRSPLTDAERKAIVTMRAEGMKMKDIAKKFECHERTVYNVLRAAREGRT